MSIYFLLRILKATLPGLDRQKKTVMVDDGLGIREEVVSPDIVRFSSATKSISPNTLTVDLRKLSLVDQSETSNNSFIFEEQQTADFVKNQKRIIFNKNIESDNACEDSWTESTDSDHHIGDDNQGIDDSFDCDLKVDYNSGTCDSHGTRRANDYRDCIHTVVNNDSYSWNNIDDDICRPFTSYEIDKESIPKAISEEKYVKSLAWKMDENFDHATSAKNNSKIDRRAEIENDTFPKLSEVNQVIADKNTLGKANTDCSHSTSLICDEPYTPEHDSEQKTEDHQRQNAGSKPLMNSGVSTTPSVNQSSPDQDSIQVKDIWKALNDGGYDISREEVSKYKVNTTKPARIRSAPARRISSQALTNVLVKDVPTRAKSAISEDRARRDRERKERFDDLTGDGSPSIRGFSQDEPGSKVSHPRTDWTRGIY